ncbi:MAG TPA: 2-C-methyl-D-erythritol 2,4-cyclodiphosphate synthase [Acidimicrobiales bacterium]|nr:2-C-methyl-D-erythritol 2,4-cyclodiphosphate synthase [Acidimicrobiales bacterium]
MSAAPGAGLRIGQGFDVHAFCADPRRPLVLGGVTVEPTGGLQGHSDADVVCHALADALLGAAGLGDLGRHFPDTDERLAGADSLSLLGDVVAMLAARHLVAVNADCTVVCERPQLAPHTSAMEQLLTSALGAPVSVKATRPEALGALGRGEGIACLAVALVAGAAEPS